MASSKQKNALTLEQRLDVIKMSAQGKSQGQIADHFGVGKTRVQNTLKQKAEIQAEIQAELEASAPLSKRKNSKPTGNEQINELVPKWFVDATRRRINVTGPMMQEKALQFATDLGITTFVVSNGWLQYFVKRNNLAFGKLCGESGDVDGDVVTAWKERLPKLIEGYDERDIFNMDESGLFIKTSADKSFYIKGEKCGGGKKSKERIITISLCANLLGEKELIVIGKSARPRAFG
ncbi:tigger transposable element-derived protein 6, partial [Elysia marginata]